MIRRTQGILVGTLVAALAAGLWLATREERPDAGPLRPDPGSRLETLRRGATPRPPSGIATSTFEARPDLEVAAPPASGEDFIIEVVAADTGAPVPGARVRLFDLSEMLSADLDRLRSEEFKDGRFLLERGHRYLTGADGRVRAHRFPRRALVEAAKGDLWTRRHLAQDDALPGPLRLAIGRSEGFGARVLDPEGHPVGGVPVWVHWADGSYNLPVWSGPRRVLTDAADGIARFRFPRGTFDDVRKGTWPAVLLGVPLRDPVQRRIPSLDPATPPIELCLPETVRVVVALQHEDGRPFSLRARVALSCLDRRRGVLTLDVESQTVTTANGRAAFSWVSPGSRVLVEAASDAVSAETVRQLAITPTEPGAQLDLTLRLGPVAGRVTGTLLDPDGAPVGGERVHVRTYYEREKGSWVDLRAGATTVTSERGAFEFRVRRPCSPTFRVVIRAPSGQRTWEALSPAPADGETRDLGRLAPVALPVVASGQAVDDGGYPLEGVRISLRSRIAPDLPWVPNEAAATVTDGEGRFAVRARPLSRFLKLTARQGHEEVSREVLANSDDVLFSFTRHGAVEGRVLLSPGVPPRRVLLRLDVANAEGASIDRRKVLPDPDGRFRFDGVRPGAGTLAVTVDAEGSRREARVGNLAIAPGGTTTDPRLDPWDLRELVQVRRITLTLVDQQGAPVVDGLVSILDEGLPALSQFFDGPFPVDAHGRRELVFRGPTCLLLVSAFGHADRVVQGADRDLCLTLSPAQRVRIQVPGSAGRLPEGVVFILDFERGRYEPEIEEAEEHSREAEPEGPSVTVYGAPHNVVLNPEGEATVTFPSAGPWIASITCMDVVRDYVYYPEDLGLPEAVNWTLEPGATFASIAIPLPAGDLREVIRRLRGDDH